MKEVNMNEIAKKINNTYSSIIAVVGNVYDIFGKETLVNHLKDSLLDVKVEAVSNIHLHEPTEEDDFYGAKDELCFDFRALVKKLEENTDLCIIFDMESLVNGHSKESFLRAMPKLLEIIGNNKIILILSEQDVELLNDTCLEVLKINYPIKEEIKGFLRERLPELKDAELEEFSSLFVGKKLREIIPYFSRILKASKNEEEKNALFIELGKKTTKRGLTFNDLAGCSELKKLVKKFVKRARDKDKKQQKIKEGTKEQKGILLYGPPGTGKSYACECVAGEIGARYMHEKYSDIVSEYQGVSSRNLDDIFKDANNSEGFVVLVIDEIEGLSSSRMASDSEATIRIKNSFLTALDNMADNVIFIATTNNPTMIDSAFLRRKRISYKICVTLPDAEAREELIRTKIIDTSHLDMKLLAEKTEGFNGADIEDLCLEARDISDERDCPFIETEDFIEALKTVTSSVQRVDVDRIETYRQSLGKAK